MAETVPLSVSLRVAGVAETVTVSADTRADFTSAPTVAASYKAAALDMLPVPRTINGAVLLAPGTSSTGPGGNVTFAGAFAYEGLFLINGVVANETLRNQVSTVFIEDAIEETKVMTANISAEYGRFVGGVANTITKSGGNNFSGSMRVTLDSDSWRSLTPYEQGLGEDPRLDTVVPTYEGTLGGRIIRDKLWFFTAGRLRTDEASEQTFYTNITYPNKVEDKRYELKGTWAATSAHTLKGTFTKRTRDEFNNTFGDVMDTASFYDNQSPEDLFAVAVVRPLAPWLLRKCLTVARSDLPAWLESARPSSWSTCLSSPDAAAAPWLGGAWMTAVMSAAVASVAISPPVESFLVRRGEVCV